MVTTSVVKTKFLQINDKRFYFPNGVLSLPFGHPSLEQISELKAEKGQKIEQYFWEGKEKLLEMEEKALENTPRLKLFDQILNIELKIVNLNKKSDFESLYPTKGKKTIQDIVLSGERMR